MKTRKHSVSILIASALAVTPVPAISDSSKSHIQNVFDWLSRGHVSAQLDDYDEFFLDQPSGPFGEDQWTEITPDFADMYPDGRGIRLNDLNIHPAERAVAFSEVSADSIDAIFSRQKQQRVR